MLPVLVNFLSLTTMENVLISINSGADPGFDQGGAPDHDRPKIAILGPQFCRILVLGPHFWWPGGGPGPRGPPWIRPCNYSQKLISIRESFRVVVLCTFVLVVMKGLYGT